MKIERADRFRIDRSFKGVAATSLPSAELNAAFGFAWGTSFGGFFQTHWSLPTRWKGKNFYEISGGHLIGDLENRHET